MYKGKWPPVAIVTLQSPLKRNRMQSNLLVDSLAKTADVSVQTLKMQVGAVMHGSGTWLRYHTRVQYG